MTNPISGKVLATRLVELLMNTINSFQNSRHRPHRNTQLCNHLSEGHNLSNENAMLRNELAHYRNQPEGNKAAGEHITTQNQQSQHKPITSDVPSEKYQPPSKNAKREQVASQDPQETEEDVALRAEVAQYRERHAQLLERYGKLTEEMKRKKIDSFEDLAEYDKDAMKVLIELARLTAPIPMEGNNVGLFGLTSTGKSTLLNALVGQKVAQTGVGETTTTITPYNGTKFTLWDVPGRNDEVSYLSMEYISFFKGLSRRLILIQATVKENSSMMKLLDEIGIPYAIIVNKFDKVDEGERPELQKQIRSEIEKIGLKGVENVFFVSAKHPDMFSDWTTMTKYLENL